MLLFAVPMILGNIMQQCYNLADTWIVGRFVGAEALAAVGSAYTLMTFFKFDPDRHVYGERSAFFQSVMAEER